MSASDNIPMQTIKPIPHWMVLTLCWLFAILYGVWILPETVFIRHFCLVVGALLSLYVIYPNRRLLLKKEAAPIWLIGLLILWVTFHLFFIGKDFNAQWEEYTRIWKKIAVGSVFAIGLGIALLSQVNDRKHTNQYWRIVYFGFLLPAITYFVKLGATTLGAKYGFHVPIYLVLEPDHLGNRFGISRAWYVFFCLPAVAMSIGIIFTRIKNKSLTFTNSLIYVGYIPTALLIFYIENDRLGTFFGFLLILLALVLLGGALLKGREILGATAILFCIALSTLISYQSFMQNSQWRTLISDAKVAIQGLDKNTAWQNVNTNLEFWPINELGQPTNNSNYLRISWAVAGSRFVMENPLGYGLLSLSFGALCKQRWPESEMSWTHSAWLDFTLGYGIPGLMLLLSAALLASSNGRYIISPWFLISFWALPTLAVVLLVKEISSEVFISAFIFIVVFSSTLSLDPTKGSSSKSKPIHAD